MRLEVSFRNTRSRPEIRRRAEALFAKAERFLDPAGTADLIVGYDHEAFVIELNITAFGASHQIREDDADLRTALDRAFHRIETTLRRAKEKRLDRRHAGVEQADGFEHPDA